MWRIWKSRNDMLFREVSHDPMEMVRLVRKQQLEFKPVRWKRPVFWVMKVNCDGAWWAKTCKGGYGWVMRDFAGLLQVAGGEGGLFFNTAAMAEAAAIRAALLVCLELGYVDVEIESDSQVIITMLNGKYGVDATLECYIHDIGRLVSQLQGGRFGFVKWKGNAAAYVVASYVASWRCLPLGCY
ncbi:hypothetical protein D8674_029526 [Pyrus ussuriensis x Pyrus communis]|uniref:RNase H type-1 domain-containing protein n=1 Tax=Pyrus ussuriensis x Pyrus communis TaxID=2448454 RepID=A0A5N5I083_9ROSA|nr:hypothetical protein D8674_029526 [Pyrus ussuriensis x Pyrus communis]